MRSDQPWAANVGWLVMARSLEDANLKDLMQATGAHFRIVQSDAPTHAATASESPLEIASKVFTDTLGPSTLRLDVDLPQDLNQQRKFVLWLLLANALVLVVLAIAPAVVLLDRLILKRPGLFASKALATHARGGASAPNLASARAR